MPLELRPTWCLTDREEHDLILGEKALIHFGEWTDRAGTRMVDRNGDDWQPGESVALTRQITLATETTELRRQLKFGVGSVIGVAARWICRTTATAGTHVGGPTPLVLSSGDNELAVEVPSHVAREVEIETCLIVTWTDGSDSLRPCPTGSMVWSDAWARQKSERIIYLEGDQFRIPVNSVSFRAQFDEKRHALWSIEVDPTAELDDLAINAVRVLVNSDVLARDFLDSDGNPEAGLLTPVCHAGIQVDVVRSLTALLDSYLETNDVLDLVEAGPGTVGSLLGYHLVEAFGSISDALTDFRRDTATFDRKLWGRFAPESWRS